jgi:hypothetical protein
VRAAEFLVCNCRFPASLDVQRVTVRTVPNPDGGPMSSCTGASDANCGVTGFYRAGSNFREDGTSIGW